MPCYRPLKAYRAPDRSIVWSAREGYTDLPLDLPCGQCIHCRLEKSRQIAMRCVHELESHQDSCFITLTYKEMPFDGSVHVEHFQDFMKRLRERIGYGKLRYYHCGEYGERNERPHYHALLFGYDFKDRVYLKHVNDFPYYTSEFLNEVWGLGNCIVGDVTFESAAYVARYVTKKVTGVTSDLWYAYMNPETGEIFQRKPEYATGSKRPGIGANWLKKFKSDVYPRDEVVVRGKRMLPPKYYDVLLERHFPEDFVALKQRRVRHKLDMRALAKAQFVPCVRYLEGRGYRASVSRLAVREECHEVRSQQLVRGYENGS